MKYIEIYQIMAAMEAFNYEEVFVTLFKKKEWAAEELITLKFPFFLHTGEYEQLARAIQFWNENFPFEERNAKLYDYLSLQNNRFAERLALKVDVSSIDKFKTLINKYSEGPWAKREVWYNSQFKALFPDYKVADDFADIEIAGSNKVLTY